MATKRRFTRSKAHRESCQRNFEQYVLSGMISNLQRIYYERRNCSHSLMNKIGLAVDTITELRMTLKEHSND